MGCNCGSTAQPQEYVATLADGKGTQTFTTEADLRVAIAKGRVTTWRAQPRS